MLKIKIVAMGKLTEPAFKAASDEYLARLNKISPSPYLNRNPNRSRRIRQTTR